MKLLTKIMMCVMVVGLVWSQDYVGSSACMYCHSGQYGDWADSGHPFKANIKSEGWNILGPGADGGPQYPDFVSNYQENWMSTLGTSWDTDITGVVGGFGWKARFLDNSGKIVGTLNSEINPGAGQNQFNFFDGEEWGWVDYHPSDDKTYNYGCFRCHTTGPSEEGTWLDGVDGLGHFAEDGVGCEACHGPGSDHVAGPNSSNIDLVYEYNITDTTGLDYGGDIGVVPPDPNGDDVNYLCGTCHNRGFNAPIEAKSGYIEHHEPWEEFITTDHYEHGMTCTDCHDPHKRVIWGGDGITASCTNCHTDQQETINHLGDATCVDCHMPYAGKSAVARGESGYKADIHSHLFTVTVDAESMFNEEGNLVQDDENREASLDLGFTCLGCHNNDSTDGIFDKTIEEALASIISTNGIHGSLNIEHANITPSGYSLQQNYPNPFNPETTIEYTLKESGYVKLAVYDILGQNVVDLVDGNMKAGFYQQVLNAENLGAGIYFYKLETNNFSEMKKMILLK
ncbi:MAG: T9SS type A sorting domain-containing protein [Candidatus Marinimicrobia bacterium]|nr:T9SS type A sorting domain-containing protein [Candidatus Neomarinimicrobiota bacterium]